MSEPIIQTLDLGNVTGPKGDTGATGRDGRDAPTAAEIITAFLASDKIDSAPTENSDNLVSSGGVFSAIEAVKPEVSAIDFSEDATWQTLRNDTDNDTRYFFTPLANSGYDGAFKIIRHGSTVSFLCKRNPTPIGWVNRYPYNFSGNVSGADHHNFGVVLPDGWRPYADVYAMALVTILDSNSQAVVCIAPIRILPDGSFGSAVLYRLSDGAAITTASIIALEFSASYVCAPAADASDSEEEEAEP